MAKKNTIKPQQTDSQTDIRNTVEKQFEDKQIMSAGINYLTLKRMYPHRLLSEILNTEGYVADGSNYRKI